LEPSKIGSRKDASKMIIGTVVGSIVATRKNERLVGQKLLIIRPMENMGDKAEFVAIDNVGAGIGETVLVAKGSAARIGCDLENSPVDAAIVGIVDET
jgi:ethanolamine utilization protein EutN